MDGCSLSGEGGGYDGGQEFSDLSDPYDSRSITELGGGNVRGASYSDAIETIASTGADDGAYTNRTVSVMIGSNGKISTKQPVNGKSTSFAASYFDSYVADENAFYATLTAKVGKEVVIVQINCA